MAVVEEHRSIGKLVSGKQEEFRDVVQAIASNYDAREEFVFGWSSYAELVNSITLHSANPPALVAVNTSDMSFAVLDGEVLPQDIIALLTRIREEY